jgi:NitT/TauT family transport system substrate-binding protein
MKQGLWTKMSGTLIVVLLIASMVLSACSTPAGSDEASARIEELQAELAAAQDSGEATAEELAQLEAQLSDALAAAAAVPTADDKVLLALDWVIFGRHTPYFVALEKGFFSDNGIEATIVRGFGSVDSTKRLAAEQADFVFADLGALILARANGDLAAKMVLMAYGNGGHAVFFKEGSGILTPADLVGKTIAGAPGASVTKLFEGFLPANGIAVSDVNIINVDAQTLNPLLLSGEVDGMLEFVFNEVQLRKTGAEQGFVPGYFLYSAYDFPIYANGLIATDEMIENNPDLVRRMADAVAKGYAYAFANPVEACEIMRKYNPDIAQDVCEGELALVDGLVMTTEAQENGIGYMVEDKVQGTIDIMREYLGFTGETTPSEVFTNDFVPGQ